MHNLHALLNTGSSEQPLGSIRLVLLSALFLALSVGVNSFMQGFFHPEFIPGYMLVGLSVVLFGWGADSLWRETMVPIVHRPLAWYAYGTRLPFWYFGGAVGYTFASLLAKRWGLLSFQDIPIKETFSLGGKTGLVMHIVLQVIMNGNSMFRGEERTK